jgi:hypothetical protein
LKRDAQDAGREASMAALRGLDTSADCAIVFATAGYEQDVLVDAARRALGSDCVVAGCSGEGVIVAGESREVDCAVGVLAMSLESSRAESHLIEGYDRSPVQTALTLARKVGNLDDVIVVFVFVDGLVGDCTAFLRALRNDLPGVTVVGGTAADAMSFQKTYQYGAGRVASGAVSALVLRGRGKARVAMSHGCTPVGLHQTITEVRDGWLARIDGRPAWDVFREYLDGDPQDLNAEGIVHLCVGTAIDPYATYVGDPMIIRTPLALNKENGALFFPGGGLHDGQRIRMTRRDGALIRSSAAACAKTIAADATLDPVFVLQFDCAGRGKVLFGACAAQEIVQPLRDELGHHVPWVGFHTYGEIAEIDDGLHYHNYTVALCAFYDE